MGRINVFLKDELLDEVNREAERENINRSSLIQSALEEFLQAKRMKREEEKKQKEMQEAARKMEVLAKKLGDWNPQSTIRKYRDKNLKGDK